MFPVIFDECEGISIGSLILLRNSSYTTPFANFFFKFTLNQKDEMKFKKYSYCCPRSLLHPSFKQSNAINFRDLDQNCNVYL